MSALLLSCLAFRVRRKAEQYGAYKELVSRRCRYTIHIGLKIELRP